MGNVNDKLAYIGATKDAIKAAIEAKGVIVPLETTFRNYAEKIGEISSGTTEQQFRVRFIDFDGTILKEEFVNSGGSSTPPTVPDHASLVFDNWTHDSSIITDDIDIGPIYHTIDTATYLFVHITSEIGLSPTIYINKPSDGILTVDWGDGLNDMSSFAGNISFNHNYVLPGDYQIKVQSDVPYEFGHGTFSTAIFGATYRTILTNVYLGNVGSVIAPYSFYNATYLTEISIPNGVASIGQNAFYTNLSLKVILLPSSCGEINNDAFSTCRNLFAVSLPPIILLLAANSFKYCLSLEKINLQTLMGDISDSMFYGCYSLTEIKIPEGVSIINNSCFNTCYNLVSITLPQTLTMLGDTLFQTCFALQSITLPPNLSSIGSNTFRNNYVLNDVILPYSLQSIGESAFQGCYSLKSIVLPPDVINLPNSTFAQCYTLESIVIEGEINNIGSSCFNLTHNLSEVVITAGVPPAVATNSFYPTPLLKIYVPDLLVLAYQTTGNWVTFANYIYPLSARP